MFYALCQHGISFLLRALHVASLLPKYFLILVWSAHICHSEYQVLNTITIQWQLTVYLVQFIWHHILH